MIEGAIRHKQDTSQKRKRVKREEPKQTKKERKKEKKKRKTNKKRKKESKLKKRKGTRMIYLCSRQVFPLRFHLYILFSEKIDSAQLQMGISN
jgi:hypothetical protein